MAAAKNDSLNDIVDRLADDFEVNLAGGSRHKNFPICTDHELLQNLFCTTCIVGVCYRCLIESHNGHPLDYYDVATAKGISMRNAVSWELEEAINELTVAKRKIFLSQRSMERKVETARRDIKEYMRKCHVALEKREQDLLRDVSRVRKQKKSLLEEQQHEIGEQLDALLQSYNKLHNSFSLEDPVAQAELNSEALRELASSRQIPLVPASSDRVHFWRDFNMRVIIRRHLGILEFGEDVIPRQEDDIGYFSPDSDGH